MNIDLKTINDISRNTNGEQLLDNKQDPATKFQKKKYFCKPVFYVQIPRGKSKMLSTPQTQTWLLPKSVHSVLHDGPGKWGVRGLLATMRAGEIRW